MGQPLSDVSSRGHVDSLSTACSSPKAVSISSLSIRKRARAARESAALACPSKKIAPEDGLLVPKGSVRGRGPATQDRAINYVVMQQGCHIDHLDDLRERRLRGQRRRVVVNHPQRSEASWRWGRDGTERTQEKGGRRRR
jgi:hypothetical protein